MKIINFVLSSVVGAIAVLSLSVALSGCSTRMEDFTVIGARNLDFERYNYEVDKNRRITGADTAYYFTFIPLGLPDYETAVANACLRIPNCVGLSNATIRRNHFWLVFGYSEIEAEGNPILRKRKK